MLAKAVRTSILFGAAAVAYNAYAAEEPKLNTDAAAEVALEDEEVQERVVVTGSRIRKAEFSEASPIQVISGDISREMGLFDAGKMLQTTNQASGIQIDNTFGGYVLDNGPGAATIGFRGLGAERTLVLINGRRMAPAGVGGAPTSPDLNLIPGVMIQRVENLFDGASTVYGSDAVAGVANVILKKDVEGFEFNAAYSQPKGDGGEETQVAGMWGKTLDNGFISVGVEYNKQAAQSYAGNDFVKGCEERFYYTEDGQVINRYGGIGPTVNGEDTCDIFPLTNRISVPAFWGSLYYTPNYTNTGIPNFSESTIPTDLIGYLDHWIAADSNGDGINDVGIVDGNGDGFLDFDFQDPMYAYQQSEYYKSGDYKSGQERISAMVNGEFNFQDSSDSTFYYEALYAKRKTDIFGPGAQIFEWVPASNPFNPCGVNGIDCLAMLGVPVGPQRVRPIINIRGDRDLTKVEVEQYRLVAGVTGNLPFFEAIGLDNWYYDFYVSHSASKGTDKRVGINAERLLHSLNTATMDADGNVTCGDGSDGCVPVNLFADNIFQAGGGTLTEAEANYLFIDRTMETKVDQTVISGYVGGDLFNLPWNNEPVSTVFGMEWREDSIESNPNAAAADGLLWGYFADQGADGSRRLKEAFAEFEFPLVRGMPGVEELTFTASGRISDESFYDAATTYSLKGVYRPVEWVTIRGTQGTSYRAPNLRERFLNGTTGFNTVSDPCVVPEDARIADPLNPGAVPVYDPSGDKRDASVLQACRNAGVDPTALGMGADGTTPFTNQYSAEVVTGGSTGLAEETSTAKTYGLIIEQPFSDDFNLTLSATRFDIEVTNSIAEPSSGYSINQCYSADGNAAFCDRIDRDSNGQIDLVDASFINIGLLTSKGWDYNAYYSQEFVVFENSLEVSLDVQATQMTESLYDVLGTVDDNLGEPDVPEWRASALLRLEYADFSFNWQTRFIGGGVEDYDPETDGDKFVEDTVACTGMYNADGSPLLCRAVDYTEDYWVHNVSLAYTMDNYEVSVGVRNVFNDAPPKVDPAGSWSNTNIPLGVGYEQPRTVFVNFGAKF